MSRPGLKQFRHEGCLSYLIFDPASGAGILVDPRADLLEDYREYVAEKRLSISLVVDTRLHWHHLSGSHLTAEAFGVPVAMFVKTQSQRVTRGLQAGEILDVGAFRFKVLETPGVSGDAISLLGEGLLLTGDTLWIGAATRADLPGSDLLALFKSQRALLALSDDTIVLPAYDLQELVFSTIEIEKKKNPDLRIEAEPAFIEAKRDERPARGDGDIKRRFEYNWSKYPEATAESHFGAGQPPAAGRGKVGGVASINVEKFEHKIEAGSTETGYIDVREPSEFAQSHIPGMSNIPLSELPQHWSALKKLKRVYLSCQSGRRSQLAATTLDYLGLPDVVNVSGGFRAWENAGLPVISEPAPQVSKS